ncbi:alpha/beta fold hydrolase [Aquitalea aquatica]|uniref:Alpha/beta hydrolase n=1 Tax=Aquitalea aquatica TaxID=3044273 RepID=A0A838Y312_9NEIS|nr:alpha/beta hydrolase [Aquitalea magnusonii]MBA4709830.1 alpha/beta hydrolase [Aquitalea magnusonii]
MTITTTSTIAHIERNAALPRQAFSLPFATTLLRGDCCNSPAPLRHLLLLHGAGQADRSSYLPLRQHLQSQRVASSAFDFIGHGETGGSLLGSSLRQRVEQALAVYRHCHADNKPVALLGSSMGAYIALHLLEQLPCSHLILQVPGAYTPQAFDVPFGPAFSAMLRQPLSWLDSDAWSRLQQFRGHVLIVAAKQDAVIPRSLIEKLYASTSQCRSSQLLWLAGAGHQLQQHWQAQPTAALHYHRQLLHFLQQD